MPTTLSRDWSFEDILHPSVGLFDEKNGSLEFKKKDIARFKKKIF